VGLGEFEAAARGYEQYAEENPAALDAESTYYAAGDLWERVGIAEALSFYDRYLKKYPDSSADHVLDARYRVVVLTEESRGASARAADVRAVNRAWEDLSTSYQALKAALSGARGHSYAYKYELRKYLAEIEVYKNFGLGRDPDKNARLILSKEEEMKTLQAKGVALITADENGFAKINDFETYSGLLVAVGDGWVHLAMLVEEDISEDGPGLLIPKNMRNDDIKRTAFTDKVKESFVLPFYDQAKPLYERVLSFAEERSSWSIWQTEALKRLATVQQWADAGYAEEKEEYRGGISSGGNRTLGPRQVVIETDEPEPAGDETEPEPSESGDSTEGGGGE
jgi:tetratricopeptide (TPR) repeat protein